MPIPISQPILQTINAGEGMEKWKLSFECGLQWWKHQILAIRPVVSGKGPGSLTLQKRISTKSESSEANKVFSRREKSIVRVDRHTGRGRVLELHPHNI